MAAQGKLRKILLEFTVPEEPDFHKNPRYYSLFDFAYCCMILMEALRVSKNPIGDSPNARRPVYTATHFLVVL